MKQGTHNWAILGGGLLGMTLALRLAQKGHRVTLIEAAPQLGGLAEPWRLGDVTWDRHYHVVLASDTHLRSLLAELDLEQEIVWKKTRTGFYIDSTLYSLSDAKEFLLFPPLNLLDKLRLAATILHASGIKHGDKLERVYVTDWLERWSGRRVVEKIWLPLLRAKLGENYRRTSAAFIWATISRMYAARRAGMKSELFGYVPGGYARILTRFLDALRHEGVRCQVGHAVTKVCSCDHAGVRIRFADGGCEIFDQAILTTPAPVAARVCPQLTSAEKNGLTQITYQAIICASLLLDKGLSGFYITNIADGSIPFTAVIEMSALVDPKQFKGRALVYLPKYMPSGAPEFDLTDEQVRESFLGGLERMYPSFSRAGVRTFRVSRVKYVMPVPTIGYSKRLPPVSTSVLGVHMVNSAHILNGTLNVNETVQLAERWAEKFGAETCRDRVDLRTTDDVGQLHSEPLAGPR